MGILIDLLKIALGAGHSANQYLIKKEKEIIDAVYSDEDEKDEEEEHD